MNKPIRVLHIVTHMNRGGLETMIMNYYRHIDRSKIQFDFLTHRSEKKDYDDEIESLGGKIYHLPPLNPFSLSYRKALKSFFMKHQEYQIVHCHLDCMSSLPLKYAKKAGIQNRIAHSHNTSQEKNIKFLLKLFYKNQISKYATDLYACGRKAGEWMYGKNTFYVLNNAIDTKKFLYNPKVSLEVKKDLNLENYFVIGHVGRFNEQKNHTLLIDIFNELSKKNDKARLVLIGEGDLKEKIVLKVKELGIEDKVMFMGLRTDIYRLMQAMDVFLFPSLFEGLPVTLVEAQASGLPCIISNTISDESIITDDVNIIDLNECLDKWCTTIENYYNFQRKNTLNNIKSNGFDVVQNVNELKNKYLGMVK